MNLLTATRKQLCNEIMRLEGISADSQNHNENVVDPIMDKLVHAGMKPAGLSWMAEECIERLAKAEEQVRWIPVGERKPILLGAYPVSDGDIIIDGYYDPINETWGIIEGRPKVHAYEASGDYNFQVKYWWDVNYLPLPPSGEVANG